MLTGRQWIQKGATNALLVMNQNHLTQPQLAASARDLHREFDAVYEEASHLPEVAKRDLQPRLKRLDTMIHALEREVEEVSGPSGASFRTTEHLNETIETELHNLEHEVEILGMGAPTPLSAAYDAGLHAAEKMGEKLKHGKTNKTLNKKS